MKSDATNAIKLDCGITRREINALLSVPCLNSDCGASLPQANSVNRLYKILCSMKNGPVTPNEVSMSEGIVYRQATYYLDAIKYLGLTYKPRQGVFAITDKGMKILEGGTKESCLSLAREILSHPAFKKTFELCIRCESIPKKSQIIEIMRKCRAIIDSPTTENRRAASIRDWIIWIASLPYDVPIE